ncbi:WhiB family transcriptional regulator [Streptomyces sp. NPDC048266]|uniref:WhiB family transcriptional regulator n=1 Tax=Streptomyces sp. NPDC048266 TaxID=3155787 RepID=UPI0033D12B8E
MASTGEPYSTLGGSVSDWRTEAACANPDVDPNVFFRHGAAKRGRHWAQAAKKVCARCPVDDFCLQVALQSREGVGVWGGKTPSERRKVAVAEPHRTANEPFPT